MNSRSLIALVVVLSLPQWAAASGGTEEASSLFRIDGYSSLQVNYERPWRSRNVDGLLFGTPMDSFPLNLLPDITAPTAGSSEQLPVTIRASGTVGAETGEVLLDRFTHTGFPNRDHLTIAAVHCRATRLPADAFVAYRYIDNYSDRFDSLRADYAQITGRGMAFAAEGLAHEVVGGCRIIGSRVRAEARVTKYGRWGATPLFFSPIYTAGYEVEPCVTTVLNESVFRGRLLMDLHRDYYDHDTPAEYLDKGVALEAEKDLTEQINVQTGVFVDTRTTPSRWYRACVTGLIGRQISTGMTAWFYSNARAAGEIDLSLAATPNITLGVEAGWYYRPAGRSFSFMQNDALIAYRPHDYESVGFHGDLSYTDTLMFPLSIGMWYNYWEKPQFETLTSTSRRRTITQDTLSEALCSSLGGKARYSVSIRKLGIDLWGHLVLPQPTGERRFHMGHHLGIDLVLGSAHLDSAGLRVSIESRSAASLRYRDGNTGEILDFVAPRQTSVSTHLRIPFRVPVFVHHQRTILHIRGGPFRLAKEQRLKEHPHGNLIGPEIAVGIDALIF